MKKTVLKNLLTVLVLCIAAIVRADDAAASRIYAEGRELYLAENYYDAAKKFAECRTYSRNPTICANSLKAELASYRMCKLYYREFKTIEKLLSRYPDHANCTELIAREFEIGKLFREGAREPAFWAFRWVPFWIDIDRTGEIYTAALARAPFSEHAPAAHLQLAIWYDLDSNTAKSIEHLRKIVEEHPASKEYKYALLGLANGLFTLAGRGGGDSRYIVEAVKLFKLFCAKFPEASEIEFARTRLERAKDLQAAKLFEIAEFYRKNGRTDVAERYLAEVMRDFPDSEAAPEAEKTIVEISDNYLPVNTPQKIGARIPDIKSFRIPENAELLLVSPGDKNSPYLLNVPDLKGEKLPSARKNKEENKQ